jgi:hypothetical protein
MLIFQEFEDQDPLYLYKYESRWLIGADYLMDSCIAFVENDTEFIEDVESVEWNFVKEANPDEGFDLEFARVIHARV